MLDNIFFTDRREENLQHSSVVVFVFVTLLIISCAFLINFGLGLQQSMLKASGLSYEQRILLEQVGKKLRFLIKSASEEGLQERVILKAREDVAGLVEKINENHEDIDKLLRDQEQVRFMLQFFSASGSVYHGFHDIHVYLEDFNRYMTRIMRASTQALRAGYDYWEPSKSLTDDNGPLLESTRLLNRSIYSVSLLLNNFLSVVYGCLLLSLILGLWLIWYVKLRPLTLRVEKNYQEISDKNKKLAFQANNDDLTLLPRRVAFQQKLTQLEKEGAIYNRTCLILIDVDNFKSINDSFGHQAGDLALIQVAQAIQGYLLDKEFGFRLAGDEFALVFENVRNKDYLIGRVTNLLHCLRQSFDLEGTRLKLTCSIGVGWGDKCGDTFQELFSAADNALYHVKKNGRNHYCFFDEISEINVKQRLSLEKELIRAVESREFVAHYQPIVCLNNNELIGFEALARWKHPRLGLLLPKEWMGVADQLSILSIITCQILDQVISDRKAWLGMELETYPVHINLTEAMLVSGIAYNYLEPLIQQKQDVSWLGVEINESIVFEHTFGLVKQQLILLHEAGIKIALDDFGTGFANLAHLRTIPFDTLKLDQSFIAKLLDDDGMRVIVKSLQDMVNGLGKQLVCEGVESPEVRSLLLEIGCYFAQGFLFSRAMSFRDITVLLVTSGSKFR